MLKIFVILTCRLPWKMLQTAVFTLAFHITNVLHVILLDFSLTVKAATLIFISGWCSAISSAKQGKSGSSYNLVKN